MSRAPVLAVLAVLAAWVCLWLSAGARAGEETFPASAVTDTLTLEGTYVDSLSASTNFGTATTVNLFQNAGVNSQVPLLRADLSEIPSNHAILAAHIETVVQKAFSGQDTTKVLGFFRVMHPWEETGATWDSSQVFPGTLEAWAAPGIRAWLARWNRTGTPTGLDTVQTSSLWDFAAPAVGTLHVPASGSAGLVFRCDVTDAVRRWHSGVWQNDGVALSWDPRDYSFAPLLRFYSDDNASNVPVLIVTHQRLGGPLAVPGRGGRGY